MVVAAGVGQGRRQAADDNSRQRQWVGGRRRWVAVVWMWYTICGDGIEVIMWVGGCFPGRKNLLRL
jgi:hypothetical protein